MSGSEPTAAPDRSVPRRQRKAGKDSRDGRGRKLGAPPILEYGFRPFFLAAAIYAAMAIPAWLWLYFSGLALPGPFAGVEWHIHEMLFGYLGAVIAGFVLTAVPNWTGRLPLSGTPLAGLLALWLAGRIACAFIGAPLPAMLIDLSFPLALAFAVWREVAAGKNWRNAPVAAMLALFVIASALHHAESTDVIEPGTGVRLALGVATILIALIGGRIVPSFTRNWLVKQAGGQLPASFGRIDRAALLVTVAAVLLWIVAPWSPATGISLAIAGVMLGIRLYRWRGTRTLREPIVAILHMGYLWLCASLLLLGGAILFPGIIPSSAALHAITAGAIGTMTLAVMTRASLGHTGRAITADGWTRAIYVCVTVGAIFRVAAPFASGYYTQVLIAGGLVWSAAFLLFAIRYGPYLLQPRVGK